MKMSGPKPTSASIRALAQYVAPFSVASEKLDFNPRPSIPIRRYDRFVIPSSTTTGELQLKVAFSERGHLCTVSAGTADLGFFQGTTPFMNEPEILMRVLSGAVRVIYNGSVLSMGSRVSYIQWNDTKGTSMAMGTGSLQWTNVAGNAPVSSNLLARHTRMDREVIIPWRGIPDWRDVDSDTTAKWTTPGYSASITGTGTPDARPSAGLIVALDAATACTGNVSVEIVSTVEYYTATHAGLATAIHGSQSGVLVDQTIRFLASHPTDQPHSTSVSDAARKIATHVGTFLSQHFPTARGMLDSLLGTLRKPIGTISSITRGVGALLTTTL